VLRPTPRARLTRSVRWTPTTTATSASRCGRPRLGRRAALTEALGSTARLTSWHASVPRARVPRFYMGWPAAVSARLRPCCAAHTSVCDSVEAGCGQEFLVYASARPELRCQLHVGSSLRDSRAARR
jgi:hypothetical protein